MVADGVMTMTTQTEYLDERAAAAILGLSPHTLARWRWIGDGPRFRKFGKSVRYSRADLMAYAEAATRSNTSQASRTVAA